MKIPENTLWQYLEKEHLDPDNELTNDQWQAFVDEHEGEFGERASVMGQDMMENFKIENNIEVASEFTDDDGNPISEDEQGRADAEADRLDKGEDE
jgi:hypothetical protein|tara:strand:- start:538 stop:825 length:288 start_codon:yes stop_codon:yes gene_type:complete